MKNRIGIVILSTTVLVMGLFFKDELFGRIIILIGAICIYYTVRILVNDTKLSELNEWKAKLKSAIEQEQFFKYGLHDKVCFTLRNHDVFVQLMKSCFEDETILDTENRTGIIIGFTEEHPHRYTYYIIRCTDLFDKEGKNVIIQLPPSAILFRTHDYKKSF